MLSKTLSNRMYAPHPDNPAAGALPVHRPGGQYGPRKRRTRATGGTEYPGLWEPILDAATATAVRELLASPARRLARGRWGTPAAG